MYILVVDENKKKYGFEADKKQLAITLSISLTEFINKEEFKEFFERLKQIGKMELMLQGLQAPDEEAIQDKEEQYFIYLMPKIYDWMLTVFQKEPRKYKQYGSAGRLEVFTAYSFYQIQEIANIFERQILQKYKK